MQFLLKLQQPCCHTVDSGWGVPRSKITTTKEDTPQKAPERTEAEKGLFCFLSGGKFSFVVSPSRVQSQNSRTTVKKRLPRQQGKSGCGSREKKERANKELALGRPSQQRGSHTLQPPDWCRKQKGEGVIMWSITMVRKKVLSLNWTNSDFWCFASWNVITSPISHIREKKPRF